MDVIIAPATQEHVPQICEIWEAGWREAHATIVPPRLTALRTSRSFMERTHAHVGHTCVALSDNRVLGFCMVTDDELYQMYVSPSARGAGVAQMLMQEAERRVKANGFTTAWLACSIGNDRAARFYEKSGWANARTEVVDLDTSDGSFPLKVWRFERKLTLDGTV